MINYQAVIDDYKSYGIKFNEDMVLKAIEFAVKYHGSQKRASGEPYYSHPIKVARIIAQMKLDSDSIVTAILHDTIEDTTLTFEDIKNHFNENIAKLVDGVTKLTQIETKTYSTKQAKNFGKLLLAMSDDIRVVLVKLADRLHNMRTIDFIKNQEKKCRIAQETMDIYAPLAERMGAQRIKTELQDISFRILNPDIRSSILSRFEIIETNKENLVSKIITRITDDIKSNKIQGKVYGRKKTPYSIWMKMNNKNVGIEQLSDIMAFRIIVDEVQTCYQVLGVIHSKYKMIPGNFQDFISTPKENGYQSLHTIVIGPSGQKIEIQIRTKQMHEVAELGVAAHWSYKQGYYNVPDAKSYKWIRELLSIWENNESPEDFLQNTKLAMYYDQVFCFTPTGDIVSLPKGATTVDFAYSIHSDVGNSCVAAKINGRNVPIKTALMNGDQVEIITSKNQSASPGWYNFVVTGKAKSEIKKSVYSQTKEQHTKLGQSIVTSALKNANVKDKKQYLQKIAEVFSKNIDDFFFSVGKGFITKEEIYDKIKQIYQPKNNKFSVFNFAEKAKNQINKAKSAVPIKGLIDGIAVNYAKCCHPLFGDKITGVVHTGRGVTIHTSDCEMLNNFSGFPDQLMELSWSDDESSLPLIAQIYAMVLNKPSGISTVLSEIAREKSNVSNLKIINRSIDYFEILIDIEISTVKNLDKIINYLRTKKIVQKVERVKN